MEKQKLKERKSKTQKGITLVALIITIIVLLILAVVAIRAVQGDGIIQHAKDAKSATIEAQEKEQIGLAVNEWKIQKNYQNEPGSFKSFMISKLKDTGIATSIDGDDNGPLTVTMKSGNVYIVTESDGITPVTKGLSLSSTTLSISPGATAQLTATLTGGVTGNIIWTSENTDVVTITTSEDKLTATLTVAEGAAIGTTVEIAATCGEYSAKCTVTVEETSGTDKLAKYILGENGEGRDLFGILNPSSFVFIQDPDDSTSTMHQKVKFAYVPEGTDMYIRYNRNVYKFSIMQDENGVLKTAKDSLTLVNTPAGNLGKYVTYQGKTWIVFREDADVGVELISANALGSVTLGGEDFDNARTSYNNAISILTQACKDATGITGNIRNVGGPAENETTTTVDFSELTTFEQSVDDSNFAQYEGEINGLKVGDEKYISDYEQMENLGILATDTPTDYWLASRFVYEFSNDVEFRMRYVLRNGGLYRDRLCNVNCNSTSYSNTGTYAVRPVVTLSSGILDSATQSGTIDDPIILQ